MDWLLFDITCIDSYNCPGVSEHPEWATCVKNDLINHLVVDGGIVTGRKQSVNGFLLLIIDIRTISACSNEHITSVGHVGDLDNRTPFLRFLPPEWNSLEVVFIPVIKQQSITGSQPEKPVFLFLHKVGGVENSLTFFVEVPDVMETHTIKDIERVFSRQPKESFAINGNGVNQAAAETLIHGIYMRKLGKSPWEQHPQQEYHGTYSIFICFHFPIVKLLFNR